jgi:hypothetical protein
MSDIRVECYTGSRDGDFCEPGPERFKLRGRDFVVSEVDGHWYSPASIYFRVLADDGNYYILRHDEVQDSWTLDAFRAARRQDFPTAQVEAEREAGILT